MQMWIICVFIVAAIGSGWYYYHNHIKTVNDYILIKIIPPQKKESLFGGYEYSKPKFEFEKLPNYANDDMAVAAQKIDLNDEKEYYMEELRHEQNLADSSGRLSYEATVRMQICKEVMEQRRILVRVTHIRDFSSEEALKIIQEHWADKTLEKFIKDKDLDFAIYNID